MTLLLWVQVIILGVLIVMSGFFSGSETALTSLGKLRSKRILMELDEDAEQSRFGRQLQYWLDNTQDILISILIGNNIVNIAASALATVVSTEIFREILGFGPSLTSGAAVATGIMTLLILVFGEITPKSYAKQNPEHFSRIILPPIITWTRGLKLVYALDAMWHTSRLIIRIMGWNMPEDKKRITEDELKTLVLAGREEGALEETELQMLHSVFEFDETVVREIIIPRTDIVALDVRANYEEVIDVARRTGYSRIPVYEDKLDQIVGILNIKDLIIQFDGQPDDFDLRSVSRPAYFVPETKKVNKLLAEFRHNQVHMAIVVDEYGGTSGIITLEDILEQIVGEIHDEYDEERDWVLNIQDGVYIIDARIDLDDLEEQIDVELPAEEFDSLGGMMVEKMGKIPDKGDSLEYQGNSFAVVSASEKRVKKVRLVIPEQESTPLEKTDIESTPAENFEVME